MLDAIIVTATALLAAKVAWGLIALSLTIRHLKTTERKAIRAEGAEKCRIYILVPLLEEQQRLSPFLQTFGKLLAQFPCLNLVLVTTEREKIERHHDGTRCTTEEALLNEPAVQSLPHERFFHFHYPGDNKTLSQQINFAINAMWSNGDACERSDYILIYNADSLIDEKTIERFFDCVRREKRVVQQSALFFRNMEQMLASRSYIAVADALLQSRWTLEREIPRYLIQSRCMRWIPTVVSRHWQVHCVGHGLLIQASLLQQLGGMPEPVYGLEDSALGFALGVRGIPIAPLGVLENADAATSFRSLLRQKSTWVRATWGTLEYAVQAWRQGERRDVATAYAVQGLYNSLKWSFGVPAFLTILWFAYGGRFFGPLLVLYLLYCYLPLSIVLTVWRRQPPNMFPRVPMFKLLPAFAVYVLAPVAHGLAGALGFGKVAAQLVTGHSFRQGKTA
jgi:hypothetical protein